MTDNNNRLTNLWVVDQILPHCDSLERWLKKRFPNLREVEDVVQESIMKVMKAYDSGPIINPRAYLFLTARNLVFNRFRHMQHERIAESDEVWTDGIMDDLDDPLEETSRREDVEVLVQAIKSLPRRCRQVITLRKIHGYSLKEVAKIMGVSVSTVDAQSCIAIKKCTEYFKKNGF